MNYLQASAAISACGLYRYELVRTWDVQLPPVVFCMLNPSTADGEQDDPTIRRCVGFAKQWGYGGLVVVNLFAFRATEPRDLFKAADPVGPDNDAIILGHARVRTVVCAWGASVASSPRPALKDRAFIVRQNLDEIGATYHLGLTKDGHPKHPLYLSAKCSPISFSTKSTPARVS